MPTELEEALTAANVAPLIQKVIDPVLLEYVRRYSPLVRSIETLKWGSSTYYFNTRTALAPGGFVTDGGARPVGSSTYVQSSFAIKNLQAVGAVTGYAQEVTRAQIGDLRQREIEGTVQGLVWDIETAIGWGASAATQNGPYPEFDGFDSFFNTFSGSTQNAIDFGGNALSLSAFDQLIDMVESNAAMAIFDASWMLVLSPRANSKIAQLLTNQQRFNDKVEVAAGLLVPTYRDIPLIKSSFLSARSLAMNTVTASASGTGGTLSAATYRYVVEAVMARYGELVPCAEVSATPTAGQNVTLSFTPPSGPDGASALTYRVYRTAAGGATGTETFLGYVDANVGLSSDGITPVVATSIVDTGAALIPQNGATQPATLPSQYFGTNAGMLPRTAASGTGQGGEDIYLVARDPNFVVRPYVRDIRPVEVYPTTAQPDALPFALVSDTTLGVRAPKYGGRVRNVVASL